MTTKIHPFDAWHAEFNPGEELNTHGDDYALAKAATREHVWTLSDESGSGTYLTAGLHHINALGYFITEKAWTDENQTIVLRECK